MTSTGKENAESTKIGDMCIEDSKDEVKGYGIRHVQCLVLFCCLTTAYSMRSCIGVSLVAMVDSSGKVINDNTINIITTVNDLNETYAMTNITELVTDGHNESDYVTNIPLSIVSHYNDTKEVFRTNGFFNAVLFTPPYPKFHWSKKWQDVILSSFQWGYMLLQIPAGQLAHRFGSRILLVGALTINCLVSFSLPWAAYYGGWISTVICRILQGLSQACIIPGIHTFLGKWAPLEERARLAGFVHGGSALGTVLGLPITGFIASSPLGWPGIFRFYGILSGLVAVLMWYILADTPAIHPKISVPERRYIETGLGQKEGDSKKHLPVPWGRIFRCRGVYAIILAHIGQTWGQLTLYTEVPAFMDKVMGVNIRANGLLTALPFLVMWITNFFFSWLADMLIVRNLLSVTNTRKLTNSLGCIPAAAGLVALAYVPKDIYIVESVLIIICAFKISAQVGFQLNHIDLSPNFAGTLMSISNFVSNLCGSAAPLTAGLILTDVSDEHLWRKVFFVAAGLYFFTNLAYVTLGTAELAEWNEPPADIWSPEDLERKYESEPMITKSENGK